MFATFQIASAILVRSPRINVTSAVSIATSVPVPIAIPISVVASAGASFIHPQQLLLSVLPPVTCSLSSQASCGHLHGGCLPYSLVIVIAVSQLKAYILASRHYKPKR